MNSSDFVQCRRAARSDGPDWLIGDNESVRRRLARQGCVKLAEHDRLGQPGFAIRKAFPDADNRHEARSERREDFQVHECAQLAMVGAPFRMAENDVARPGILQHFCRDVPGMRAGTAGMAILRPDAERAAFCVPGEIGEQRDGRTDQRPGFRVALTQASDDCVDLGDGCPEPVHLPVSCNQCAH